MPVHTVFLVALTACTCPRSPGGEPPPPIPQDATTVDGAALGPCEAACLRYRELGCPEGEATRAGHLCEDVCLNAAARGVDLGGAVPCTSAAGTCQEVRSCSSGR